MSRQRASKSGRSFLSGKLIRTVAIGLLVLICLGCPLSWLAYSRVAHDRAISGSCEWARLAPLPVDSGDVDVEVTGNLFTRGFVLSFTAEAATIDRWLAASPGPSETVPVVQGSTHTYTISPGGGAMFAEVVVDTLSGRVRVRTYWS